MADAPTLSRVAANGATLALWEWPGSGAPVVFVHATGFHGHCWDQVVAQLGDVPCYAVDQRGHGRSDKPDPPYDWRVFGDDLVALLDAVGVRGAIGVGHSLGGYAVTQAAATAPHLFEQLMLIDPVILPRDQYRGPRMDEHFAARRRNRWAGPDEMFERFKDRPPFNRWQPEVLHDYCQYGLLSAPDGNGYVLACPPAIEAAIYRYSTATDIYPAIAHVQTPTLIVRLGTRQPREGWDMEASPTAPDLHRFFARGYDLHLPQYTHFMPMESPEHTAALIRAVIAGDMAHVRAAES